MTAEFKFSDVQLHEIPTGDFSLKIPAGIQSKAELLDTLSKAGRFPDYFGANWDALMDCLSDFSWIPEKQIVIIHGDLPLLNNAEDCSNYIDVLRLAVKNWSGNTGSLDEKMYTNHKLQVVFPVAVRNSMHAIFNKFDAK
jgi:RNAse (barnase) inhibitor barstar